MRLKQRLTLPLAMLAVSLALIGVYLAAGGAHYAPAAVPDPCHPEGWPSSLHDTGLIAQRIGLSAVEGAACVLHVSTDTLALALRSRGSLSAFADGYHLSEAKIEAAVRQGLGRAVGDAERAGAINGFESILLSAAVNRLPLDRLLKAVQGTSLSW